ncbi:MAG: carboxypeptidase regulatory-like domain-containing protein [Opitutaceae bacterium]|nr:carboxypeptidase regulatory-like domain-containing protein [Opitutaceae bacterium]
MTLVIGFCALRLPAADAGEITGTVKFIHQALSDAVVYIEKIEGKTFTAPQQPAVLDQVRLTFVPHVLPVLVGTKVSLPNNDVVLHNVFSPRKDKKFDLGTYRPGLAKTILCDSADVLLLLCRVHPEMSAFIVVVPTPYYAVTNEKGAYRITGVPPGSYRLAAWHEAARLKTEDIVVPERGAVSADFLMKR